MYTISRSFIPLALILLAGCSSSDSDLNPITPVAPPSPAETSRVQALHASPDAPAVNVTIGATEVPDVDYKTGLARSM